MDETLQQNAPAPDKGKKIEDMALWVLLGISVLLFVLTGSSKALIMGVIALVWLIVKRFRNAKRQAENMESHLKRVIIFVVPAVFVNLVGAPFFVGKSGVWRYPLIKKYVSEIYHPVRMPAWFPDKLPESSTKCSILYLPSAMQGSGYFSVCFNCSTDAAKEWAALGEENAKYIVPLTDYNNARELSHMGEGRYLDFLPSGYETDPKYAVFTTAGDTEQRSVDIVLDNSFWYGDEEGTMIYIMETNLSVDKPYNEIVIVNKEKGLVQLFSE